MEVLYLIRLFQGVGIPLHRPHILLIEVSTSNSNHKGMVESMIFLSPFPFRWDMYQFPGGYRYLHFGMLPLPKCSLTTGILADFTQVNGLLGFMFCHYEGSGSKPTKIGR